MGYMEGLDRVVQTLKLFVPNQPEDSEIPVFYVDAAQAGIKHELDMAVKQRLKVELVYRDSEEEYMVLIYPYQFYSHHMHTYFVAYCEQSGEVEHYRLDDIVRLKPTGASYDT